MVIIESSIVFKNKIKWHWCFFLNDVNICDLDVDFCNYFRIEDRCFVYIIYRKYYVYICAANLDTHSQKYGPTSIFFRIALIDFRHTYRAIAFILTKEFFVIILKNQALISQRASNNIEKEIRNYSFVNPKDGINRLLANKQASSQPTKKANLFTRKENM